jgi:hypothetical protein
MDRTVDDAECTHRIAGVWSETTGIEGDPPSSAEPHG